MNIKNILEDKTQSTYEVIALVIDEFRNDDGLNLFVIDDGTARLKLTKFVSGQKLFLDIKKDCVAKIQLSKKEYRGELQGEPITMSLVDETTEKDFRNKLEQEKSKQYEPKDDKLLVDSESFRKLKPKFLEVATIIRKAIFNKRPIHISHHNDCDGFSAGLAIERAIRSAIEHYFPEERMVRNYLSRQSSRTPWYDLSDATKDIGTFAQQSQRFDLEAPLVLILDNGSSVQDLLAINKVKLFGCDVAVIDHHDVGEIDSNGKSAVCKAVSSHVNPHLLGIEESMSASMLCYQVAYYINRHDEPSVFVAATGGVDDYCVGETIDLLVKQTGKERSYFEEFGPYVDFEIYHLRSFYAIDSLTALLYGDEATRTAMMKMYKPIFAQAKEEIMKTIEHYHVKEQVGKFTLLSIDGEQTTIRGDFFTIGKYASLLNDGYNFENQVTMITSNGMIVFRAQNNIGFDANAIIKQLKQDFPYARVNGGGHAVAGSVKFVPAAQKELVQAVKNILQTI